MGKGKGGENGDVAGFLSHTAALAVGAGARGCQSRSRGTGGFRSCLLVFWKEDPEGQALEVSRKRMRRATWRKEATGSEVWAEQAESGSPGGAAGRIQPPRQAPAPPPPVLPLHRKRTWLVALL